MEDIEVISTRRVEEPVPRRLLDKIVLTFKVMGKDVKIHVEFKEPVEIGEIPRTVIEAPEDGFLEALEALIYVHKEGGIAMVGEVAGVEEDEEDEESKES